MEISVPDNPPPLQDLGGRSSGTIRNIETLDVGEGSMEIAVKVKDDAMVPDLDTENKPDTTTVLPSSGGSGKHEEKESCQFNKRGVCREHKVVGVKSTSKKRVWVKKKFGWGWSTITSVKYSCLVDDRSDYSATDSRDEEVSCFSRVNKRVPIDTCVEESSRSLVGPQISEAEVVEVLLGPND